MKIYTKTGDKGITSLYSGEKIEKFSVRVDLYGTIDELQAAMILATQFQPKENIKNDLEKIIKKLSAVMTDIATITAVVDSEVDSNQKHINRISTEDVSAIENLIDAYTEQLPALTSFIIPGGSQSSAFINLSRTICRRAERLAVRLSQTENEYINQNVLLYMNRLSDFLFTAVRLNNI